VKNDQKVKKNKEGLSISVSEEPYEDYDRSLFFIGTKSGCAVFAEIGVKSENGNHQVKYEIKYTKDVSVHPLTSAVFIKVPFPQIIVSTVQLVLKGVAAGNGTTNLISMDIHSYDTLWQWNVASNYVDYTVVSSKLKSKNKKGSVPQPKSVDKTVFTLCGEGESSVVYFSVQGGEIWRIFMKRFEAKDLNKLFQEHNKKGNVAVDNVPKNNCNGYEVAAECLSYIKAKTLVMDKVFSTDFYEESKLSSISSI
jgi:hypothetical protein